METKKNLGIVLGVVVLLGVLFVTIFLGKKPASVSEQAPADNSNTVTNTGAPAAPKNTTTNTPVKTPPVSTVQGYTLGEVQAHSSASSCWTIVNGNVYNLTSFVNGHPGGRSAILSLCGKDGSSAFDNQHGGQRRPENELKSLYLGVYKK